METPVKKFIYKMSWFESKRHRISNCDMYFANPVHTRDGLDNPLCKVFYIAVDENDVYHKSAVENSNQHQTFACYQNQNTEEDDYHYAQHINELEKEKEEWGNKHDILLAKYNELHNQMVDMNTDMLMNTDLTQQLMNVLILDKDAKVKCSDVHKRTRLIPIGPGKVRLLLKSQGIQKLKDKKTRIFHYVGVRLI